MIFEDLNEQAHQAADDIAEQNKTNDSVPFEQSMEGEAFEIAFDPEMAMEVAQEAWKRLAAEEKLDHEDAPLFQRGFVLGSVWCFDLIQRTLEAMAAQRKEAQ